MWAVEQTLFDHITCSTSFHYPLRYKMDTIIIPILTGKETDAQIWWDSFFMVTHQVVTRARNLCSKPGLSYSRF